MEQATATDPGIDTLEFLMKSHFPSTTPTLPVTQKNVKISTATINSTDIAGFDMNKLEEVVQSFKNKMD